VIAVVDDEESVRKAVVRLLQAAGHTARGYASGPEFLENWLVDRPDCLLLDLQMPGLSGMDVQSALNRAKAHIPVVVATSGR
jgi:FixJ family two-component response regulator